MPRTKANIKIRCFALPEIDDILGNNISTEYNWIVIPSRIEAFVMKAFNRLGYLDLKCYRALSVLSVPDIYSIVSDVLLDRYQGKRVFSLIGTYVEAPITQETIDEIVELYESDGYVDLTTYEEID